MQRREVTARTRTTRSGRTDDIAGVGPDLRLYSQATFARINVLARIPASKFLCTFTDAGQDDTHPQFP